MAIFGDYTIIGAAAQWGDFTLPWKTSGRTGGDRTRDPNIKSVVLYQLSYSPRSKRSVLYHIFFWLWYNICQCDKCL